MKWISIKERLPEPERPVFAMCNINGKQIVIRACWIPDKSKEDEGDYEGDSVYDESQDKYFWPEGWYEWNLCEETHYFVSYSVTHWLEITGPEDVCDKRMNIQINQDYRIEADNNNIILRKRKILSKSKDESKIGTEYWDDDGYYNTLESLFFGLARKQIIASDATSFQELVSEVKALYGLIEDIGSNILPKDIQRICEERA